MLLVITDPFIRNRCGGRANQGGLLIAGAGAVAPRPAQSRLFFFALSIHASVSARCADEVILHALSAVPTSRAKLQPA